MLSVFEGGIGAAIGRGQSGRSGVIACLVWGLLSTVLFGIGKLIGQGTDWFVILASLLKVGAFLLATVLCWRNAKDPDIVSGRSVWQAIALGMLFHVLGDITVILWRSLWGITSVVSLGDVFYGASYLFLAIGLLQAVLPRQMTLNLKQTLSISVAGIVGIVFASWITFYSPTVEIPSEKTKAVAVISTERSAEAAVGKSAAAGSVPRSDQRAPEIIQTVERRLSRITRHLGLGFVVGDGVLGGMAVALLVAFWGGSYAQTWRLVAIAGLCLYVADMFLIYEIGRGSYQQGALWEIFWVFSALFFGLSAGAEQGISAQMKSRSGRREWL